MSKRKRTKKYNSNKSKINNFNRNADSIIENSAIYQLPENKCEFISLNNQPMDIEALRRIYCDMPHKWTVALIVFKITKTGSKALEVQHVSPPVKCFNDAIADSVESIHNKMISKCEKKEFVCGAWLALPRDEIISSTCLMSLFDDIGVWRDYITDGGYVLFEER